MILKTLFFCVAGNLKVMNNKYKLEAPDLSEVDTSDEKSRKRKRGTDRPCNLHGKYDLRKDYLSWTCFPTKKIVKLE